jgi:hypothetical protein
MPDITVHRHGDRWAVAEAGAESAVKEFDSREAAELAAEQMAAGGSVEVVEEDPTGLGSGEGRPPEDAGAPSAVEQADHTEHTRTRQAGL